jgi:hypothetical protein
VRVAVKRINGRGGSEPGELVTIEDGIVQEAGLEALAENLDSVAEGDDGDDLDRFGEEGAGDDGPDAKRITRHRAASRTGPYTMWAGVRMITSSECPAAEQTLTVYISTGSIATSAVG